MTFGRDFTNAVEQKQIAQQEAGMSFLLLLQEHVTLQKAVREMLHSFDINVLLVHLYRARQVHCREGRAGEERFHHQSRG